MRTNRVDADIEMEKEVLEVEACTNFRILSIATHNINGIKGKAIKLESLAEWAYEEKIDIIGINELNISEQ